MILWCDQVTVTPDDKRMMVFKRGMLSGLNGVMELGGHKRPISIDGERLL